MEIMLFVLMIVLSVFFIYVSLYLFEKDGLLLFYLICNVISYLLSFDILNVLGINVNANVILSSLFILVTYVFTEKLNIKEFRNVIKKTFITNVILSIFLLVFSLYIGTIDDVNAVNMQNIFLNNYKILISYPIVTLIIQLVILLFYNVIKVDVKNVNYRIILTSLTVLMIDTILFCISSYIFSIDFNDLFVLIISDYLFKVVITMIYTPFVGYMIGNKKVKV